MVGGGGGAFWSENGYRLTRTHSFVMSISKNVILIFDKLLCSKSASSQTFISGRIMYPI